jgi:hypothetical protein
MLEMQKSMGDAVSWANHATSSRLQLVCLLVAHFILFSSSQNFQVVFLELALFGVS